MALPSWTAPRTWVTDEIPTAAIMNTHIRDNLLAGLGIAGVVNSDGTILNGANFTVSHNGTGSYTVSYQDWGSGLGLWWIPMVQTYGQLLILANIVSFTVTSFTVEFRRTDFGNAALTDTQFGFHLRPSQ